MPKASIKSKDKTSDARMEVSYVPSVRGGPTVFFDRVTGDGHKILALHSTPRSARRLAQWMLEHIPEEE